MNAYDEFLATKFQFTKNTGFDVDPSEVSRILKPHQRDLVRWAVKGGNRAIFAAFGLGKTYMQEEIARIIQPRSGGPALIVCPLGCRQEFLRAAPAFGLKFNFIRHPEEMTAGQEFYVTNYESIRDGKLDPNRFAVVSLDEASVLRSYGSKTYQEFLPLFNDVPYKFVATATPSPNRYKELIHYAGFLGIMDTGQALTRFFQRDSTQANNLTLYPHMEKEFYTWLHSWAIFLQKPSDLGYSDEGYALPPLDVRYHEVAMHNLGGKVDRDGQIQLINDAAIGLKDAASEKRDSIDLRVAKAKEIVDAEPDAHFILWHDLNDERAAIEDAFARSRYWNWLEFKDGNSRGLELYERHYSARHYAAGRVRELFIGPGEKTVLLTQDGKALFGWRKFIDDTGQIGVNCSVFRNEGSLLSSDLIREAMAIAWKRWPGQRLYTYVDPEEIKSTNPGCCFLKAGWSRCGETPKGLLIFEAFPPEDVSEIPSTVELVSVYGSQDLDEREQAILDFGDGLFRILSTKPRIAGSGCNFQRHCHRAIFTGIGYKFNDFIQAIHRIYRFLQPEQVIIDIIYTETERAILAELKRKWAEDRKLREQMSALIRKYGLSTTGLEDELRRSIGVTRKVETGAHFEVALNDCVDETRRMEENSVDLIHTSIPFGNHYEYTASYNDFGHNEDNQKFFKQMDFLTPHLLKILRPGRVAAIHVKDRIRFGNVTGDGMPTVDPFHCDCIQHYRSHGFRYMGMITVVTDVVRENNQTYRLGWSENCKDGTKMGVGSPEYILLFRKLPSDTGKAYADVRVEKSKADYTRARWQVDAHAFWRSGGNRMLSPDELAQLGPEAIGRWYQQHSLETVYDHEEHIALGEALDNRGALPATFMTLAPGSHHPDVWHDVNRMLTLNGAQTQRGLTNHICPLQFDIVDRIIRRYTNEGEIVFDPFGGLFTVAYRAIKLGRTGRACELNAEYFKDGVKYLREAELERDAPSLFDVLNVEGAA